MDFDQAHKKREEAKAEDESLRKLAEVMVRKSAEGLANPNNTKLTPDLIVDIVRWMMKYSSSVRAICQIWGVSERSYRNWMRWGKDGKAPIYEQFFLAVKRAEAWTAMQHSAHWMSSAKKGDWKAAKAFLESRYPEDYGRQPKLSQQPTVVINVTLAPGQPLTEAIPSTLLPMVTVRAPEPALEAGESNSPVGSSNPRESKNPAALEAADTSLR